MMSPKRILFICTGNSCRSVMAQYYLQDLLRRSGIEGVTVESAGVFAIEGMPSTRETQRVLQAVGVDCSHHQARILTREMVQGADCILVMEPFHLEEAIRRAPDAKGKVHLLKPYGMARQALTGPAGIPDPIGKPIEIYEVCFADIQEAVERIAKSLEVPQS